MREVFNEFLTAHPELGLRATENTFKNFSRIHGPRLLAMDVARKPSLRAPFIANVETFDAAAFDLISRCGYSDAFARTAGAAERSELIAIE